MSEEEYRSRFAHTPLERGKYAGFLRNVCTAMGNSRLEAFREQLERLAGYEDEGVREHACWALARLGPSEGSSTGFSAVHELMPTEKGE
jgi:epoxyqueuosine reductase